MGTTDSNQPPIDLRDLIALKRDGGELSPEQIERFVTGAAGSATEVQLAAMLMAIYIRGLRPAERTHYALSMMRSGDVLDWTQLDRPTVDKHSTGGVGDKVSLIWAPMMAALGFAVPMISGRGLGHTGGTLDKLEAIPGYRTDLDATEMGAVLRRCGAVITGQTATLVPADRTLYDLRSRTGTVPTVDHIAPSIMSKKLAEGAQTLILDVKVGAGAFMKNLDDARELAAVMVQIGQGAGRKVSALLTAMDAPLGLAIGNALEVVESVDVLRGGGPSDLRELCVELAVEAIATHEGWKRDGADPRDAAARARVEATLHDGSALHSFEQMVEAQGGDVSALSDPGKLRGAGLARDPVFPSEAGSIEQLDALGAGLAAAALGGGRGADGSPPHPGVGVLLRSKPGDPVHPGEPFAFLVHDGGRGLDEARSRLLTALSVRPHALDATAPSLLLGRIGGRG